MFGAYLTAAIRNIARRKLNGIIGVVGLGVGFAVATMIALFLRFETSFDSMHPGADRMYRLNWLNVSTGAQFATFFNPLSPDIAAAYPDDIEALTRIANSEILLSFGDEARYETISFVDPSYFAFFGLRSVDGDAAAAIEDVRSAVLTRAAARHMFGSEAAAMGRTFTLGGEQDFTVAAVIEDNPLNSHLVSNIFLNMELLPTIWGWPNMWESKGSDQLYHYVRLAPTASAADVSDKALQWIASNVFEGAEEWLRVPLQPVGQIHFTTELQNEMTTQDTVTGAVKTPRREADIYVFLVVAVLTLAIATFNFMNLQIVQITNRMREIGVRKVLGATRRSVIAQFMLETSLMAGLALVIGITLTEALLPMFGNLVAAPLPSGMVLEPLVLASLIVGSAAVTLLAGAYPALIAGKLMPARALQGEVAKNVGPAKVRTGLVLAQFSIATGLIIASGVVGSQIDYALKKPLGFDAAGVARVMLSGNSAEAYGAMKQQLEAHPAIERVSNANILPSQDLFNGWSFQLDEDDPENKLSTRVVNMGYGAFEMMGMQMLAGRGFSEDFPADMAPEFRPELTNEQAGVILNETAARNGGWRNPADAIGQTLVSSFTRNDITYRYEFTIVGVVADAHYRSIRSPIAPLSYMLTAPSRQMIVKIDTAREAEALAAIDTVWQQHVTDIPIRRSMVADDYASFYAGENRTFSLVIGLAGIAIAIACLGLYGLTTYMVERRIKEVGIRRVLGATVAQIVTLLSWDYTKLVIVASIVVWPVVWWLMLDWLAGFAYRAELQASLFVLASLVILLLATMTTSVRTYLAARTNPIHALRTE